MTADDITPDRLRMAGWDDDRYGQFTHAGAPGAAVEKSAFHAGVWYWDDSPEPHVSARLAGMADVAARVAAAGGGEA